jgi:hypothetical protein
VAARFGFAMIGELGAIYFTVYNRKRFWRALFSLSLSVTARKIF